MEIIFKKISIKNFKGITELELEFNDKKNIIQGENGIGKTTILDAITWCLFGKNFADEKQFKIKPIIDGEEKSSLATSVELVLNDKVIERIWDKDVTTIKVDSVKFGSREFSDYLRDNFYITDEEFKALSNIDYIPKLHWKELRSLIVGLVGEIKNEEVYERGNFDLIKEKIESVGVEKTAENITESKSNLNNEIKKLLGNIDQKTNDIKTLVIDDEEIVEYTKRKEKVKEEIDKYNQLKIELASQDEDKRNYEKLDSTITNCRREITRLEEMNVQYQKSYDESNIDVELVKENQIKVIQNKIIDKNNEIEKLNLEKTTLIADREELKKQYDLEINKEIKIENDKCTSCGQLLPKEKIDEVLEKLKQESINSANIFANKAKEKLERMNQIDIIVESYKNELSNFANEIENVKNSEIDPNMESDIQKMMKSNIANNLKEIEELNNQISKLTEERMEFTKKIATHKNIEIPNDINLLQNELEELTQKMAISSTLETFKNQLKDLEDKHQELLNDKALLNEKEQQLILFNNTRAEMLREKVKHNFKLVDFITQETTKDGKLIETFKIAFNGIEYSAINTGHKILLALDLIENIQRLKNKKLPILIDGLGELTRLPELESQVIGCRAKFQVNKKLELSNE